jgi:hypothetical protein
MLYRRDHDATIARIAALDVENAGLRAENERLAQELATPRSASTEPPVPPKPVPFTQRDVSLALVVFMVVVEVGSYICRYAR